MTRLYYAGLDSYSLPLGEGERLLSKNTVDQLTYLKALSLVSSQIVVPPSFYINWVKKDHDNKVILELSDMYQADIIISSVHSSMAVTLDFLEYKKSVNSAKDRSDIEENIIPLTQLFKNIPLTTRDVYIQSGGFREKIILELEKNVSGSKYRSELVNELTRGSINEGVQLARNNVNERHYQALLKGEIDKRELRSMYYATNRCYYMQGARTYNSKVAMPGAYRYSAYGPSLYDANNGVVLGYDPVVVLGILNSFGITKGMVRDLTIPELDEIRGSKYFDQFVLDYNEFSAELQQLHLATVGLSRNKMIDLQMKIRQGFTARYFKEAELKMESSKKMSFTESTLFAAALGTTGFFVIPVVGALLGLAPIVLSKTGATNRIHNYVTDRIGGTSSSFLNIIEAINNIKKQSISIEKS